MTRPFQVNTEEENIIDVPFTEVENKEQAQEQEPETTEAPQGTVVELNDIEHMVMIGRKKNGEIFFTPYQVNDLVVIDSFVNYARRELDFNFDTHFRTKAIQAQEALRAKQEEEANGEG